MKLFPSFHVIGYRELYSIANDCLARCQMAPASLNMSRVRLVKTRACNTEAAEIARFISLQCFLPLALRVVA
jgi:hypothetical protein